MDFVLHYPIIIFLSPKPKVIIPNSFYVKLPGKYVFFYCDECELLDPVIVIFRKLHPRLDVHVFSDIDELIAHSKSKVPELILVYLSKPDRNYIAAVKYIREHVNSSSIPVMIYQQLPEEKELQELFRNM